MGHFGILDSEGSLTVPQEIRRRLGLKPGDRVEFVAEAGQAVIRLAHSDVNPFTRFIGIADPFPGGDEGIKAWIDDMRGGRDQE